jgi:hypothetical protein
MLSNAEGTTQRLAERGTQIVLSSAAQETSYHDEKLGHVDGLRYMRLIASEKGSFSVFGAGKRRKGERGKSPTFGFGRANAAH